jgi:hypothetical protein
VHGCKRAKLLSLVPATQTKAGWQRIRLYAMSDSHTKRGCLNEDRARACSTERGNAPCLARYYALPASPVLCQRCGFRFRAVTHGT